jgi:cobalt-precorrin-5B (C1)-methyltransferase
MKKKLRQGYTTGACAAAAALGAARLLAGESPAYVEFSLPTGDVARFSLQGQSSSDGVAHCFVVKDAGDDPDVTHGVEVHAELTATSGQELVLLGGTGIGRVTKPGLAVAVGEPAINPVPRQMMAAALRSVFPDGGFQLTVSIPDGVLRAEKTLNARLGILGGLSILGTTGIVRPISHQAWTDTLDVALNVARAAGCDQVVACTGRSSELVAQQQLPLREEAFIMMGDHVGYLAAACHRKGMPYLIVAAQFAKLVKIACGHPQTHVRSSSLDLCELARWAGESGLGAGLAQQVETANTAREVFLEVGAGHPLVKIVAERAIKQLQNWAPGVTIEILLVGYGGELAGRF